MIEECEFDVGSQDLDDLSSKGIALTPTRTISQLSHVVQRPLSNLSPLDLHLRPKISTHTLQYLNDLVSSCDVGVVDDCSPRQVTAIDQPSVGSALRKTNGQVTKSMRPSLPIPSGSTKGSASITLSLPTLVPSVLEPTLWNLSLSQS